MTKVSIITINRNNKDGLRKTMQSVIDQDFDDFEYVVVDGASDDGSVEVIQEFETSFKQKRVPFQYESKLDRGIFHAMNKGIMKASGEYLLFLNSGDYLVAPAVLSDFSRLGITEDFASGSIIVFINDRKQVRKSPSYVNFYLLFNQSIPHQATFIKRSVFERFGLYNENNRVKSDWENSMRSIVVGGATYKHIDLLVSYFDVTGVSSDVSMKAIQMEEQRKVYLSLMPAYVLETLEYYKKEEQKWKYKSRLYDEYLTLKNGKMGFLITFMLWIKKWKRK